MVWIPIEERPNDISSKIQKVLDVVQELNKQKISVSEAYEQYRWGEFQHQGQLYQALTDMQREKKLTSFQEWYAKSGGKNPENIQQSKEEEITIIKTIQRRDQEFNSLQWFMINGETEEVRLQAKEIYEKRLIDLYIRHVNSTGETYFPELKEELINQFCFNNNIPRS